MTTPPDFETLVWGMRQAQKNYFKKPIKGRLIAAKLAEKQVDEHLDRQRGVRTLDFPEHTPPDEIPY